MGMSSPKTKAEARTEIARLQGRLADEQARLAHCRATNKSQMREYSLSCIRGNIADIKGKIAKLRAQIPSLPND